MPVLDCVSSSSLVSESKQIYDLTIRSTFVNGMSSTACVTYMISLTKAQMRNANNL